jgi:hypothetical protein
VSRGWPAWHAVAWRGQRITLSLCACMHAAREFKMMMQDLEDEVSELTGEVQHLQRFSVDSLSFEVGKGLLKLGGNLGSAPHPSHAGCRSCWDTARLSIGLTRPSPLSWPSTWAMQLPCSSPATLQPYTRLTGPRVGGVPGRRCHAPCWPAHMPALSSHEGIPAYVRVSQTRWAPWTMTTLCLRTALRTPRDGTRRLRPRQTERPSVASWPLHCAPPPWHATTTPACEPQGPR